MSSNLTGATKPQQTTHKKSLGYTIFPSTNLAAHKHCGQSRDGAQLLDFGESRVPTDRLIPVAVGLFHTHSPGRYQ